MANEDVSFIYLWMLKDEGLREEAEILHQIAQGVENKVRPNTLNKVIV